MKQNKSLFLSLLFALAIVLTACTSKESPALKIADGFNTLADQIEKATPDKSALESIEKTNEKVGAEMEQILKDNSDYELTDDDRAVLKEAMKHFLVTSMKKSMEIAGTQTDGIEETVNSMMELRVNPQIDAAKTLGELGNTAKL